MANLALTVTNVAAAFVPELIAKVVRACQKSVMPTTRSGAPKSLIVSDIGKLDPRIGVFVRLRFPP
jgi:hypothetical protein